jgi:hypothetical protein
VNPDVTAAVATLARRRTIGPAQARLFSRVAQGQLVSVYAELRLLAYAGVLLVMAGVGTHLGWLLLLGAVGSALGTVHGPRFALVLIALAAVLAALAHRQRRFSLIAVLAAYAGVSALALRDRLLVVRRDSPVGRGAPVHRPPVRAGAGVREDAAIADRRHEVRLAARAGEGKEPSTTPRSRRSRPRTPTTAAAWGRRSGRSRSCSGCWP